MMLNIMVKKVWGWVWHLFASPHAAVSYLSLRSGFQCSRHHHRDRVNMFALISGQVLIEEWPTGGIYICTQLHPGGTHQIPAGIDHRFRVIEDGEMIEVYWPVEGATVRLDDIVRLDEGGPIR